MRKYVNRSDPPAVPVFFVGVDVGQPQQPTAIAVLAQEPGRATPNWYHDYRVSYACRYLERLRPGMPYIKQVQHVVRVARQLHEDQQAWVHVAVDATGVGGPIMDLFRAEKIGAYEITITNGHALSYEQSGWRVPKRDLVSCMQLLLQGQRIKFAQQLPELPTLVHELNQFRAHVSSTEPDAPVSWREGAHDDLVLATAVAAYCAETLAAYAGTIEPLDPEIAEALSNYQGWTT